jgi:hypothetical protein
VCSFLVRKPRGNTQLDRCRWKDNIKMCLKDVDCEEANWADVSEQDHVADFFVVLTIIWVPSH